MVWQISHLHNQITFCTYGTIYTLHTREQETGDEMQEDVHGVLNT